MPTTDANNAMWFMLRYGRDFTPWVTDPTQPPDPNGPDLDKTLLFDAERRILELRPRPRTHERTPQALPAGDLTGEVYTASTATGHILVTRCDGSVDSLVCEPHVLADPLGIAVDIRGLVYVADPRARRVVVLRPEDGSVCAILASVALREPVDVAIGLDGCAYVVDREAARVLRFSSSFSLLAVFSTQNAAGLPVSPKPVSVASAPDGSILVIDANHPRVMRFTRHGEPLADLEFSAAVRFEASQTASSIRACPRPITTPSMRAAQQRLAAKHRRARLLAFGANGRYETSGVLLSAILDSRLPATQWHRVEIGADLPEGTRITVETATADDRTTFDDKAEWQAPTRNGAPIPFTAATPDQLIQSRPGRYLRLRVTLRSDGATTPGLHWIRVLHPRETYLDYLPVVYRREADAARFLERFLALFERVLTGVEDRYELFSRQLDPQAAPLEIIDWLACLLDLVCDPSWPLQRRRNLVARAMDLYKCRGTPRGLQEYVQIYTGEKPLIRERFYERPLEPAFVGRPGGVLGTGLALQTPDGTRPAEEELYRAYAHRFSVLVYLNDVCDAERVLPVVDHIVETNKPAHTAHELIPVYPDARLELQSTVGVDFVLGGKEPLAMRIGPRSDYSAEPDERAALGVDTILGHPWPRHNREIEHRL